MFPRPPKKFGYYIEDDRLWLSGSEEPLESVHARNILLRRQKHFSFEVKIKIGIVPMTIGQDAGLTCYYDENTWLKFGVFKTEEGQELKVMEHIGYENRVVEKNVLIDEGVDTIYLQIKTHFLRREFLYSFNGKEFHTFTILCNVYYLCDEGIQMGKRFTGAMVGVYAFAGENKLIVPFDFFNYNIEDAAL